MVGSNPNKDHGLAKRLSDLEKSVAQIQNLDFLKNATFGSAGLTVEQAFNLLTQQVQNQVKPEVGGASSAGFTLGTGYGTVAAFSIAVPAGFSRVVITACGTVTGSSTAPGDGLYVHIGVAGNFGPQSTALIFSIDGTTSAFQDVSLSGLSGGSITVQIDAHIATGPGSSSLTFANVVATALFLI